MPKRPNPPVTKKAVARPVPRLEGGPPPLRRGTGNQLMSRRSPLYEVTMDAGVFDFLWRFVVDHHATRARYETTVPEYIDMMERAHAAFLEAQARATRRIEQSVTPTATPGRTVRRPVAKGARR